MTDFVHHTQQHKKFTPLIRYWNWLLLQNITHSFSYIYFYRIIAFPNSVCLNSQKNLGVRENLDVVIPNYFVPLCKIQLQPKLLGKTYKYKSRGIWHMGVRKKGFQLIAIPFHYFVENWLINHQRNHISSNCLSSSNTQFRDHLVWNRAFLCVLQATLLKQETYTTPKEDKAWRDQKRVAVQHQNLHHEEQGQAGKKKQHKTKTKPKKQPLWICRWRPAFCVPLGIFVGGASFCCGETDVPKHIQMCTNTRDVFLILITTCSWFILD